MLFDLLVNHLVESCFQLTHLSVEHTVQHIFLLLKMIEIVEGKPRRFFLLFRLAHLSTLRIQMQSYDKRGLR